MNGWLRRLRVRLAKIVAPAHVYVADDLEFHHKAERFRASVRAAAVPSREEEKT